IARERGTTEATFVEWERELQEMDQLVGELLASARLDFQALSRTPLDAVEVARRALQRAGEPLDRLSSDSVTLPFSADPTLLGRALANLLDNARRHGQGVVRLEVARSGACVIFAIEDAGPGLAAEVAARIFEPPVVSDDTDEDLAPTRSHTSLGLGLVLVGRIARAHGGRARCEPRPGGGARMVLELPVGAA
ncbi:MAG TPA: ATP-binding protein, partial [Polyangia bacterium]